MKILTFRARFFFFRKKGSKKFFKKVLESPISFNFFAVDLFRETGQTSKINPDNVRLKLKIQIFQQIYCFWLLNPLTANDELSRHENLTFLWTWILRWVPRSFPTQASLRNALPSNKLCPKTMKILAVKGLNYQKVWKFWLFFKIFIFLFNPLTANDELSRHENLTFLWTWILRWVPRSFATHASLCNALSSNKLCPKTVKILAVKGLKAMQNVIKSLVKKSCVLIFFYKVSKVKVSSVIYRGGDL